MPLLSTRFDVFPWDRLGEVRRIAAAHPGGIVDLSVGSPVDDVPDVVQQALCQAANASGYPATEGTPSFAEAVRTWAARTIAEEVVPAVVLPAIGLKEFVAHLALHLGLGPGDTIVIPRLAYPTYAVGAQLAGCEVIYADDLADYAERDVAMVWLNSPGNPTGGVTAARDLAAVVRWARERGVIVASDECYIELGWSQQPTSILDPAVSGNDYAGLIALFSLSKRSNLAGYRVGYALGDERLLAGLTTMRKHLGLIVPAPVLAAAAAALMDEQHVALQRSRYGARRAQLVDALTAAGFRIEASDAGLYLWATRDEDCWASVRYFAERGLLVAPGEFYGTGGQRHVRLAFTATDERVAAAAARLTA